MHAEPRLEYRDERHYVAVGRHVPVPFGDLLPGMWAETLAFLAAEGRVPSGVPFIRYLTTDMSRGLDIQVGFPVAASVPGNARIAAGVLPAGRYAVLPYTGPYEDLRDVTAGLLAWAERKGIAWQTETRHGVEWWAGRIEWYPLDPATEPDPRKWRPSWPSCARDPDPQRMHPCVTFEEHP
jgi:effector-binding domain-containing protein